MSLTIEVEVRKIERADLIAYQLRVRNDGSETILAGAQVGVFGRIGKHGAAKHVWSATVPHSLEPGETFEASGSYPMTAEEAQMERFSGMLMSELTKDEFRNGIDTEVLEKLKKQL